MKDLLKLFSEKNIEKILLLGYKLFYCLAVFVTIKQKNSKTFFNEASCES